MKKTTMKNQGYYYMYFGPVNQYCCCVELYYRPTKFQKWIVRKVFGWHIISKDELDKLSEEWNR